MAKAKPNSILNNISGKLGKDEDSCFRTRFGKQEVIQRDTNKRIRTTANMRQARTEFGKIIKIASIINNNPQLAAPFLERYNSLPEDKRPQILYRSIIADLTADPSLLAQHLHLLE